MRAIGPNLGAWRPVRASVVVALLTAAALGLDALATPAQSPDTTTKPDTARPAIAAPQGGCISCGPTDNPPIVTITPTTGSFGTATQTITIDWCDDFGLLGTTRHITVNGLDVTAQFTYVLPSPKPCAASMHSVGTVTLQPGTNSVAANIEDSGAQLGSRTASYTYTALVVVTPDSAALTGYAHVTDTATFTVRNPTASAETFTLSTTCPTGWGCAGAPASLPVSAGASALVHVTYVPLTIGSGGTITLSAAPTTAPSSSDQGSFRVTVPVSVSVSALITNMQSNRFFPDSAGFRVSNAAPATATFSLAKLCTGSGVTFCRAPANVVVPPRASQLVWLVYTGGDSTTTGTLMLTATGSDSNNVSSSSTSLRIIGDPVSCDGTPQPIECLHGDVTPPTVAITPDTITQHERAAQIVVDWCDNLNWSDAPPVLALNGVVVNPALPISSGNTIPTCTGAAHEHSAGTISLLPGGNTLSAWRCDFTGNCSTHTALYTYDVLDVATADSALMRRGVGSPFTQAFRVTNTGQEQYVFSLIPFCFGTAVSESCTITGASTDTIAPGASQIDTITYSTPSTAAGTAGTVELLVAPVLNPGWTKSAGVTVHAVPAIVAGPVTPDSVRVAAAESLVNTYDFKLRNVGNVRSTFTLALTCTGVTSCTLSPASVTLVPNDSTPVHVTYMAGASGSTGTVKLTATSGTVSDAGTLLVRAQPKDLPVASLDSVWAPGRIERSLCVTVAVGTGGTADECGDLRVAVGTSAIRTLGETRAPTLLYGSADATATVVLPVWVSLLPQATLPDSVTASLIIGGVLRDHGTWVKAQWVAGAGRQIALAIDGRTLTGGPGGTNDHSGVYAATLQITAYDGATTWVDTLATTIPVVDRSQSAFGAGWWLAGLERLYFPTDGTLTWVGGDGSLRTYTKDPAHPTVYRAPSLTRLDSLVKEVSGQYVRYLPNRLHVRFNSAGQHIATITRLGDSTVFAYNTSGQLQTITVAPVSAAKTYTFTYDASGRLDSIAAPLGGANGTTRRTTKLALVGTTRQIASVTQPDTSLIQFTYDAAHVGRMLTSTDPRNTKTTFVYDSAGKLRSATIGMQAGTGADLTTTIRTSASLGFRGTTAVDTAAVATRLDGPRTDVGDTTVIRVTPFDAPRRMTDAFGHVTWLDHANHLFPALVTHEYRNDAVASFATYDTRAHLIAATDSNTYVDAANFARTYATTTYAWDAVWDEVTVIAPPEHDSTVMTYDVTTGNRLTQRDALGDTAHYGYNSSKRLVSVRRRSHTPSDSLTYDALGNVATTITPLGYVTRNFRDATGRDTMVTSPIDANQTLLTTSRTVYDLAERPILSQSFGPAVPYQLSVRQGATQPETLTVATAYDKGGLVRRVIRTAEPDLAHVDSLITRTGYDAAGRKVADTATDGRADEYQYDQAGHVILHLSRNSTIVTWQYDALGELVAKDMGGGTVPFAVEVDSAFALFTPSDFAQGAGDLDVYRYDAGGHLIAADNQTAQIRRTYMPNGALLSDSLRIDTWVLNGDYSRHVFPLYHTYDLDGRRRTTSGVTGDSIAYDLGGRVSGIEAAAGAWFRYNYDSLGRPDSVTYPNGTQLLERYDAQDQLLSREEVPPDSDTIINADTLTYDARGKVIHAIGHTEEDFEGYSALGVLGASERNNRTPGKFNNTETFTADAMGNVVTHAAQRKDIEAQSFELDTNVYTPHTGRLVGTENGTSETLISYTPGGDRMEVNRVNGAVPEETFGGLDDARYYYRDDGLLAAVDHRTCSFPFFPLPLCESDSVSLGGSFEDYRYDALGRRVVVRTRTENVCTGNNCHSALMWVAWDGDAIAEEVRGAGSNTLTDDSLELGLPPHDPAQQPFYGKVVYVNGPTLDQPLEIQGIIPYRTWRGVIDGGSCGSCSQIDFPGLTYEAYLDAIPTPHPIPPHSWHGTLFAAGLDESGLMYRRNRYYDPSTGQFTQEDPAGLAGGMNSYGFANGDPVNFSDPFGLCPPEDSNFGPGCPGYFTVLGAGLGAAAGALAGGAGGGLGGGAAGELACAGFPVCGAGGAVAGEAAGALAGAATGLKWGAVAGALVDITFASVNQMNKQIKTGKAPRGVKRADRGKVTGEQDHVHLNDGSAINQDGTWKHGVTELTNAIRDWLTSWGWQVPK